ncbi:MAG: hypothetical protein HY865_15085 [Chloroflexi bacterium]|nr:hypothetical protein [Chloroflexota bacterium]
MGGSEEESGSDDEAVRLDPISLFKKKRPAKFRGDGGSTIPGCELGLPIAETLIEGMDGEIHMSRVGSEGDGPSSGVCVLPAS